MANIAISNIAWRISEDKEIFKLMKNLNINNLEISPFRESANFSKINKKTAEHLLKEINHYEIKIIALQALLFRSNNLSLFNSQQSRQATLEHLTRVLKFASNLKAKVLIFGSPKRIGSPE